MSASSSSSCWRCGRTTPSNTLPAGVTARSDSAARCRASVDAWTSRSRRPGRTGPPRSRSTLRVCRAGFVRSPGVVASSDSSAKSKLAESLPAARSRAGDDLDAWPLAAAVGPERRGVDDDLRDLLRPRQSALVEAVDDEARYVVLQIAGGIRARQQQQVERQVFLVCRQPQQIVAGQRRGRQVRQRVDGELPRRVDDVDALFQPLQGQRHCQRLQAGDGVDQAVDGPKRRRRHPYVIRAGGHLHAEAAVAIRRGLPNRLRGSVDEDAHGDGPHHAAGLVRNGAGYAGCRFPGSQRGLQGSRRQFCSRAELPVGVSRQQNCQRDRKVERAPPQLEQSSVLPVLTTLTTEPLTRCAPARTAGVMTDEKSSSTGERCSKGNPSRHA